MLASYTTTNNITLLIQFKNNSQKKKDKLRLKNTNHNIKNPDKIWPKFIPKVK